MMRAAKYLALAIAGTLALSYVNVAAWGLGIGLPVGLWLCVLWGALLTVLYVGRKRSRP